MKATGETEYICVSVADGFAVRPVIGKYRAALFDTEHLRRTRQNNLSGLQYFMRECRVMGLEFVPSSANFILVRVGEGARIFQDMQKRGVITRPMSAYQMPEWLRISIGTPAENSRCMQTLREVLGEGARRAAA